MFRHIQSNEDMEAQAAMQCRGNFESPIYSASYSSHRQVTEEDPYQVEILDKIREDQVETICQTDNFVIYLGKKPWAKSIKQERKFIMGDTRKIGTLLTHFR